ncbi:hypothetical protein OAK17_00010 [Alphaproteobacteria bacterium]|nr:hypothetical protein [Alphaproteobacteria bacterium]
MKTLKINTNFTNAGYANKRNFQNNSSKTNQNLSHNSFNLQKENLPVQISPLLLGFKKNEVLHTKSIGNSINSNTLVKHKNIIFILYTKENIPKHSSLSLKIKSIEENKLFFEYKNNLNFKTTIIPAQIFDITINQILVKSFKNELFANKENSWKSLELIIQSLIKNDSGYPKTLINNNFPLINIKKDENIFLFFRMLQLNNFNEWMGRKILDILKKLGKHKLINDVKTEFEIQSKALEKQYSKNWNKIIIPYCSQNIVYPISLSFKKEKTKKSNIFENLKFIVDFKYSDKKFIQIIGVLNSKNFDLEVKSNDNINNVLRKKIKNIFFNTYKSQKLKYKINFIKTDNFFYLSRQDLEFENGSSLQVIA